MKPALTPTTPIALDVGPVAIRCYVLESGAYRTEIQYLGGKLIVDLSRSYPTEREARHHARTAALWFAHGRSVREVLGLVALLNTRTPRSASAASGAAGRPGQLPPCEEEDQ